MTFAKHVFVYMFPGIMFFWVFFIGQIPMQEILDERDAHTLQRLLAAPVSLLQFLLSKMLRCFLLCGLIQMLLLAASALLAGVWWGNPLLLLAVVPACAFAVTGLLAVISALTKTKEQAYSLSSGIAVFCALLGGSFSSFEALPGLLKVIGQCVPNRWAILAFQSVARSQPAVNVVRPVLFLCAMGLVGCLAACLMFHRQLAAGGKP
jgi:ABC-type multidrug transport system permease subunit